MFSQFKFPRCTPVFFSLYFFSLLKLKGDLSATKHLLKPINSRIRKGLSSQILTSKNWRVNFSSVLGYTRFQQSHDNKKSLFSIALFDYLKIYIFCFFLSNLMPKYFCKSCHMLFAFVNISFNQRSCGLLRWPPFIETTLGAVAWITLAWLGHLAWRCCYLILICNQDCWLSLHEVALWSFNKLCDHVTYMTYMNNI